MSSDPKFNGIVNANKSSPHFPYIFDPGTVISGGQSPVTGGWRPYTINDVSNNNISISGGINIGNVAVTGGQIAISNTPTVLLGTATAFPVTGAGGFMGITGTVNVSVTNSPSVTSTVNSGTFIPSFNVVTNGQVQIPVGARAYTILVISGGASVNGILYDAQVSQAGGGYDFKTLGSVINVGCTGGKCIVSWEV